MRVILSLEMVVSVVLLSCLINCQLLQSTVMLLKQKQELISLKQLVLHVIIV
ncbi:hypothetical protein SAM_1129 [Streptococcus agalactiae CJB111]|nr:hypothetical protein SAM_1129 [Streptococcus agalactiae CJB111]